MKLLKCLYCDRELGEKHIAIRFDHNQSFETSAPGGS